MMQSLLPPALASPIRLRHLHRVDIWLRAACTRGVPVPPVAVPLEPARRARCTNDLLAYILAYHPSRFVTPSIFHYDFVRDLQAMILNTSAGVRKLARAAPRGIGKTTLVWIAIEWGLLYGHIRFGVIIAASNGNAEDRINCIRNDILTNETLFDDFPEICGWVRNFAGDARRAPPGHQWSSSEIKLPNGAWCVGKGADSSIPGLLRDGRRPDFVAIDDPETVSSIYSESETRAITERLLKEVCFLHQSGGAGRYVLITTIRGRQSLSARLTDAKREPEWRGKRYRALLKFPDNALLWDTFGELFRREPADADALAPEADALAALLIPAWDELTPQYRNALRFYAAHKSAMDAGAELLDPARIPLHECYHVIHGSESGYNEFCCELQSEPPEDDNKKDTQLDVEFLKTRRLQTLPQKLVPVWASYVRCHIDVGMYQLHWDCVAWSPDRAQAVIECGIQDTRVNAAGALSLTDDKNTRREMVAEGIRYALSELRTTFARGWIGAGGEIFLPVQICVDIGGQGEQLAWMNTVLDFCVQSGPQWIPFKGQQWTDAIAKNSGGRNFWWDREFYLINADEYKHQLFRALQMPALTSDGQVFPGARVFATGIENEYLKQQTAEEFHSVFMPGRTADKCVRAGWMPKKGIKNHFFDTGHMSQALEDIFPNGFAPWKNAASAGGYIPGEDEPE